MDELVRLMLENLPSFVGLILAVYVLWRQNEKLLEEFFSEMDEIKAEIADLRQKLPKQR